MILIINCESIEDKAEFKVNNENKYHLHNIRFILLFFYHESLIYFMDDDAIVVGKSAYPSAYGNPYQC